MSPAQRSAQARKAAQAKWARRKESEDAPFLRGRLNSLRKARAELLAAVVDNATAGSTGKAVKGKEELAAMRAGLAELRMEIPLLEARVARAEGEVVRTVPLPVFPPPATREPMVPEPVREMVQYSPLWYQHQGMQQTPDAGAVVPD